MAKYKKISEKDWQKIGRVILENKEPVPNQVRESLSWLLKLYGRGAIAPCEMLPNFSVIAQVNSYLRKRFPKQRLRIIQSGYKRPGMHEKWHRSVYPTGYLVQLATLA